MNAHDTPSGTRMMWNASVNAIWDRAQGTGLTPAIARSARGIRTRCTGSVGAASSAAHDHDQRPLPVMPVLVADPAGRVVCGHAAGAQLGGALALDRAASRPSSAAGTL